MVKEIDSINLHEQLQSGTDIRVVDIRTPAEMARGVIPQASPLPMHLIPLRVSELPKDRGIVLYCHSGARSYHACSFLLQQGFDKVLNLRGGITAWAQHGLEIVAPSSVQAVSGAASLPSAHVSPI